MNQYETVFIMTPVLSEEQLKEVTSKYKELLQEGGCEIVNEEHWNLRKMAYPIAKKSTGFYHLFEFKAPGEFIEKLEVTFKRDERIMRFLTVKLDKYAVEYNKKRRVKLAEKAGK
jgi:small subunit ribosomal protein S6